MFQIIDKSLYYKLDNGNFEKVDLERTRSNLDKKKIYFEKYKAEERFFKIKSNSIIEEFKQYMEDNPEEFL